MMHAPLPPMPPCAHAIKRLPTLKPLTLTALSASYLALVTHDAAHGHGTQLIPAARSAAAAARASAESDVESSSGSIDRAENEGADEQDVWFSSVDRLHLWGHQQPVAAIAFTPSSSSPSPSAAAAAAASSHPQCFVSSSPDATLLFELQHAAQQQRASLPVHGRALPSSYATCYALTLSRCNRYLALTLAPIDSSASSTHDLVVVELASGAEIAILRAHQSLVSSVRFVSDGASELPLVISCSHDRSFKIWSLERLSLLFDSQLVSAAPLSCAALHEASQRLVIGSADGLLRFFDLDLGSSHRPPAAAASSAPVPAAKRTCVCKLSHTIDLQKFIRRKEAEEIFHRHQQSRERLEQQLKKVVSSSQPSSSATSHASSSASLAYRRELEEKQQLSAMIEESESAHSFDVVTLFVANLSVRSHAAASPPLTCSSPAESVTPSSAPSPSLLPAPVLTVAPSKVTPSSSPSKTRTSASRTSPSPTSGKSPSVTVKTATSKVTPSKLQPASSAPVVESCDKLLVVTRRSVSVLSLQTLEFTHHSSFLAPALESEDEEAERRRRASNSEEEEADVSSVGAVFQASAALCSSFRGDAAPVASLVVGNELESQVQLLSVRLLDPLERVEGSLRDGGASVLQLIRPAHVAIPKASFLHRFDWPSPSPALSPSKSKLSNASSSPIRRIKSSGYGVTTKLQLGSMPKVIKRSAASAVASTPLSSAARLYETYVGVVDRVDLALTESIMRPLHNAAISCLSFSADGRRIVSGSLDCTMAVVKLSNLSSSPSSPAPVSHFAGHHAPVSSLALSAHHPCSDDDSRLLLATSSLDGSVRLWQLGRPDSVLTIDNPAALAASAASSSSPTSSSSAAVASGKFDSPINSVSFFHSDRFLLSTQRNSLFAHKFQVPSHSSSSSAAANTTSRSKCMLQHSVKGTHSLVTHAALNDECSSLIFLSTGARSLLVFDAAAEAVVWTRELAHQRPVHCIALHQRSDAVMLPHSAQEGSRADAGGSEQSASAAFAVGALSSCFLTSACDSTLKLWDLRTASVARTFLGHVLRGSTFPASVSPDGRFVATGSEDGKARVFDVQSGRCVAALGAGTQAITAVAWHPRRARLMLADAQGALHAYSC